MRVHAFTDGLSMNWSAGRLSVFTSLFAASALAFGLSAARAGGRANRSPDEERVFVTAKDSSKESDDAGMAGPGSTPIGKWLVPAATVSDVLTALSESASGRRLVDEARAAWSGERVSGEKVDDVLLRKIRFGVVSKTDAVLTRHYTPETNSERRSREVTVILRKNERLLDQVLDLGHELIHALAPPSWDPYDPTLSPGRYIFALLEKRGGEIEAVTSECQVASELERTHQILTKRCDRYFDSVPGTRLDAYAKVNRARIQRDFYRVGKWNFLIRTKLKDEAKMFPFLSQLEPELYSATGRAPYPAALIKEYEEITRVACTNVSNRRRLAMGTAASDSGRSPASVAATVSGPAPVVSAPESASASGNASGISAPVNAGNLASAAGESDLFLQRRCPAEATPTSNESATNSQSAPAR